MTETSARFFTCMQTQSIISFKLAVRKTRLPYSSTGVTRMHGGHRLKICKFSPENYISEETAGFRPVRPFNFTREAKCGPGRWDSLLRVFFSGVEVCEESNNATSPTDVQSCLRLYHVLCDVITCAMAASTSCTQNNHTPTHERTPLSLWKTYTDIYLKTSMYIYLFILKFTPLCSYR